MSRTSRRASRPLIAVLAIVIVLGIVFTVHKVRKSHAQVASAKSSPTAVSHAAPAAAPHAVTVTGPAKPATPTPTSATASATPPTPVTSTPVGAVDSTALVTQTPTEKVSGKNDGPSAASAEAGDNSTPGSTSVTPTAIASATSTPAANPAPVPAESANAAPPDSSENDTAGLQEWAKGSGKAVGAGAVSTPVSSGTTTAPPAQVTLPPASLGDAKAKLDAGDLIGARQILNENLIAARGESDALKQQIEQINQTLIFSPKKFPQDPWGGSYQVAGGERLGSIANRNSVTWEFLARINNVTPRRLRQGQWIKIAKGPFYAVVTKHTFKMDLYLGAPGGPGSMFVRTFMVGLGKDNSTPTGLWMCKAGDKIRNPRYYPSRGGDIIAPDDPKNPLGGYWIAIEGLDGQAVGKESYGIHGTIEPDSIGKMSSQGCIRLRADDISWVYDLLVDGKSKVLVKD